jgi:hypothetical protein
MRAEGRQRGVTQHHISLTISKSRATSDPNAIGDEVDSQ